MQPSGGVWAVTWGYSGVRTSRWSSCTMPFTCRRLSNSGRWPAKRVAPGALLFAYLPTLPCYSQRAEIVNLSGSLFTEFGCKLCGRQRGLSHTRPVHDEWPRWNLDRISPPMCRHPSLTPLPQFLLVLFVLPAPSQKVSKENESMFWLSVLLPHFRKAERGGVPVYMYL